MGKKQIVKYRVIPERLMKDLVEFIDEIQFEASETNTVENHHILNLCTYLISCLINSDSFTDEFGQNEPEEDDTDYDGMDIPPEAYDWDSSSTSNDFHSYDYSDLSEEEYEKMLSSLDSFLGNWKKKSFNNKKKSANLKELEVILKVDTDLTLEEKFELYYDEYRKYKNNKSSKTFDKLLRELGLKKSNKKDK